MRKKVLLTMSFLITVSFLFLNGCTGEDTLQDFPPLQEASEEKAGQSTLASSSETMYRYEIQELCTAREGKRIYGLIYIPKDTGREMPAVIFSHGFGGTHTVGSQYAEVLAERGYVVYCFDFCGGSTNSKSDGSTLEMSLFTEQADLDAVISMVQGLDYVDSRNLFLMGTSQGGAVSAITGAARPQEIRGMILLYPAFVMTDYANALFQSTEEIPDTYHFCGWTWDVPISNR